MEHPIGMDDLRGTAMTSETSIVVIKLTLHGDMVVLNCFPWMFLVIVLRIWWGLHAMWGPLDS